MYYYIVSCYCFWHFVSPLFVSLYIAIITILVNNKINFFYFFLSSSKKSGDRTIVHRQDEEGGGGQLFELEAKKTEAEAPVSRSDPEQFSFR
jgi:hypothetical protein